MTHLIFSDYIYWLRRFCAKTKDITTNNLAKQLILGFSKCHSIDDLLNLIQPLTGSRSNVYGPINFYLKLAEWETFLISLKGAHEIAIQTLKRIEPIQQNFYLIELLQDFLNSPRNQMHTSSFSLLKILTDDELPTLIEYIVGLKDVPPPKDPPAGSFAAMVPLNNMHGACLKMLINLSFHFKEGSDTYAKANNLLQSSIRIYSDMHMEEIDLVEDDGMVEINLDDSETSSTQSEKANDDKCIMM